MSDTPPPTSKPRYAFNVYVRADRTVLVVADIAEEHESHLTFLLNGEIVASFQDWMGYQRLDATAEKKAELFLSPAGL